jgi:hypothetical protein
MGMKKSDTFADRRQEAEAAKARLMEKFKGRPAPDSPEAMERAAARQAQKTAQAEHKAAVDLEKRTIAQKLKAEAEAAAEASRRAEEQQLKQTAEAEEAQKILDEASRKAKRDARYANRKAGK